MLAAMVKIGPDMRVWYAQLSNVFRTSKKRYHHRWIDQAWWAKHKQMSSCSCYFSACLLPKLGVSTRDTRLGRLADYFYYRKYRCHINLKTAVKAQSEREGVFLDILCNIRLRLASAKCVNPLSLLDRIISRLCTLRTEDPWTFR